MWPACTRPSPTWPGPGSTCSPPSCRSTGSSRSSTRRGRSRKARAPLDARGPVPGASRSTTCGSGTRRPPRCPWPRSRRRRPAGGLSTSRRSRSFAACRSRPSPARSWPSWARPGRARRRCTRSIPRLYDVTSGAVRIDGRDVRDVTLESLADAIGVVSQDPHLFHDTIGANLRYARPGRHRRRGRRGVPGRAHPRRHRRAARRLRHPGGGAGLPPVGRREAAPRHRPGAPQAARHRRARRGHGAPRLRERGPDPGGAGRPRSPAARRS